MIDLLQIKQNNTYDFIQATLPSDNGTWLCTETAGDYVAGYSYRVTGNHGTRYDEVNDVLALSRRFGVIEDTLTWLNNPFYVERQEDAYANETQDFSLSPAQNIEYNRYLSDASFYTFIDGVVTGVADNPFIAEDLVQIKYGQRNNAFGYVTAQSDGSITLDNTQLRNTSENAVIYLVSLPRDVEEILAKMVWWNTYKREITDLNKETVGNYSYERQTFTAGAPYPTDIVAALASYKKVKFVA